MIPTLFRRLDIQTALQDDVTMQICSMPAYSRLHHNKSMRRARSLPNGFARCRCAALAFAAPGREQMVDLIISLSRTHDLQVQARCISDFRHNHL
jgi:hypothetical protein